MSNSLIEKLEHLKTDKEQDGYAKAVNDCINIVRQHTAAMPERALIQQLRDALSCMVNATMYKDHPKESEAALEAFEDAEDYIEAMGHDTDSPAPDRRYIEEVAKFVYSAMQWAARPQYTPEWQEHGNSTAQDEARRCAAAIRPYLRTAKSEPVSIKKCKDALRPYLPNAMPDASQHTIAIIECNICEAVKAVLDSLKEQGVQFDVKD